jgi:hypothetical protein
LGLGLGWGIGLGLGLGHGLGLGLGLGLGFERTGRDRAGVAQQERQHGCLAAEEGAPSRGLDSTCIMYS